jgi:hypothetical protein
MEKYYEGYSNYSNKADEIDNLDTFYTQDFTSTGYTRMQGKEYPLVSAHPEMGNGLIR